MTNETRKKLLRFFFAPSAFKLGLIITALFAWLAFEYYKPLSAERGPFIVQMLHKIHLTGIDIRLRLRGPREPSPDVAIVAVDELAVEKLGRWPWPRGRIAEMIDLLVSYGARVIAFDAIFSEPDNNQAVLSLTKLKNTNLASGELEYLINNELSQANTDWVLARSVEKHSDKVVLGNIFSASGFLYYPYQEFCANIVQDKTPEFEKLSSEELPAIAQDATETPIPEVFTQYANQNLKMVEEDTTKKLQAQSTPQNEYPARIYRAQLEYCAQWLSTQDPYLPMFERFWEEIKKADSKQIEGWETLTASEALDQFRNLFFENPVQPAESWLLNLSMITQGSKHNAYFNADQDSDGTIRRSVLVTRFGSRYHPSLALKSVMVAKNLAANLEIKADPSLPGSKMVTSLNLYDLENDKMVQQLPVDNTGRLFINYAGSDRMFPHVSVYEIFNKRDTMEVDVRDGESIIKRTVNKTEFFKDKILIFGATAIGIYDLRVTPFNENYPGVETHANVVDNILRGDFLQPHPDEPANMTFALVGLGILISLILNSVGAIPGIAVTALSLVGIGVFDSVYLFKKGYIANTAIPLALVFSLFVFLTFYKYVTEERKKKAIKGTFEKYVSPAIVAEVLKDPSNLELGGKKQRMTVLFSDVRGFTTIAEKLDPQALSALLNSYLTPMTELVFKNKGTLDKYMGDAIMAFFGAPIHYPDHAKMACHCCLQMIDLLHVLNKQFSAKGLPLIDIGIGLNTGDMSVGNMGSETVRSYTVMGDAVNLASRLEGINKQYGTRIIISEFTYADVKDDFICREIDWVRVKGKLQPVRIFEVISLKNETRKKPELLSLFEKGFKEYHNQNWDSAVNCFTQALNLDPEDAPSKLYLQRSTAYKDEPPAKDWDGVFEMKTK